MGITPLPENDPAEKFGYEITVWTGTRPKSDTTSRVSIILEGDNGDTEPRYLVDTYRPTFKRSAVDSFLLTSSISLGDLAAIRIIILFFHANNNFNILLIQLKLHVICVIEACGMTAAALYPAGFSAAFWSATSSAIRNSISCATSGSRSTKKTDRCVLTRNLNLLYRLSQHSIISKI